MTKLDREVQDRMADNMAKEAVRHSHNQFHQDKYFLSCYWCVFHSCIGNKDELITQMLDTMGTEE
tara:strand:- start:729 stop:923 length:195 start_codon:yes stop_codon:yes gene_type:complete